MCEDREGGAQVIVTHGQLLQHAAFLPSEHQLIKLLVDLGKDETKRKAVPVTAQHQMFQLTF